MTRIAEYTPTLRSRYTMLNGVACIHRKIDNEEANLLEFKHRYNAAVCSIWRIVAAIEEGFGKTSYGTASVEIDNQLYYLRNGLDKIYYDLSHDAYTSSTRATEFYINLTGVRNKLKTAHGQFDPKQGRRTLPDLALHLRGITLDISGVATQSAINPMKGLLTW